jgi:hypothetical protein
MQQAAWELGVAAVGKRGRRGYVVPFIRAISDTLPTSRLNVTFLQATVINDAASRRRWLADSGVQLPQSRHLHDVGGKHPSETILTKQPI